jgi:hypothetical protein
MEYVLTLNSGVFCRFIVQIQSVASCHKPPPLPHWRVHSLPVPYPRLCARTAFAAAVFPPSPFKILNMEEIA